VLGDTVDLVGRGREMGVAMRGHEASEVDRAAAAAWVRFQAELGDRLGELAEDEVLLVEAMLGEEDEAGTAPYVQFCAWGEGMLRGEVASNHVLVEARELDEEGERALVELGYDAPTYAPDDGADDDADAGADDGAVNYTVDLPQTEADRLAVMAVRALRDVFGVPHPALLTGDLTDAATAPEEAAAAERADEPVAAYPHGGHEELTALVDRALTPYFGHEPRHDDDGDIPVDLGSTVLFVRVHESVPVVELFACLATEVQDLERAAFEINVLNRDVRFVKFRLVEDSILADLQLPAWPFAPEHLRAMLALMTDSLQHVEADLLERVGGSRLLDEHDAEDVEEADPDTDDGPASTDAEDDPDDDTEDTGRDPGRSAERIFAQLNADCPGSVTPQVAASICGHDPELILDLISNEESQKIAWRQSRDAARAAGDAGGVDACEAEMADSHDAIGLLRKALRVVVERQAARDEEAPPAPVLRRRPRRHPPRPRRVPDPTLEEVDPEIWG
jgi:hypothetical protein